MSKFLKKFPNVKQSIGLASLTTFNIGGNAKYFLETNDVEELSNIIKFCSSNDIKFRVLGWGSNVLISDNGYDGLIIRLKNDSIEYSSGYFEVGAGLSLPKFLNFIINNGYVGCEFLAGIPGTIGGAIYGNAGSYGIDTSSIVESVKTISNNGIIEEFDKYGCNFSYRDSIFKTINAIIFSAKMKLEMGASEESKRLVQTRILERITKHPSEFANAGSYFKNIIMTEEIEEKLDQFLDISKFLESKKVPAGFLIESLGLKGFCVGDACVSEKHGNFLINKGNAKAREVIELAGIIKKQILEKYNIELEEEVQYIE